MVTPVDPTRGSEFSDSNIPPEIEEFAKKFKELVEEMHSLSFDELMSRIDQLVAMGDKIGDKSPALQQAINGLKGVQELMHSDAAEMHELEKLEKALTAILSKLSLLISSQDDQIEKLKEQLDQVIKGRKANDSTRIDKLLKEADQIDNTSPDFEATLRILKGVNKMHPQEKEDALRSALAKLTLL